MLAVPVENGISGGAVSCSTPHLLLCLALCTPWWVLVVQGQAVPCSAHRSVGTTWPLFTACGVGWAVLIDDDAQRDEATSAKCPSPSIRCGARENTVQRGMSLCLPTPYPHGHLGIILIFALSSLLKSWVTTACQAKPDLSGLSKYYLCFQ